MNPTLQVSNITEEWAESFRSWHMEFFVIPATIFAMFSLMSNVVLLACIYRTPVLCQETRYLLLANTLLADVLFMISHFATQLGNATGVVISWIVCEVITVVTTTAYCSAILSITLMVVDTFAAVRWPLKYREFLPPARTHRMLLGLWLFAAIYPLTFVIFLISGSTQSEKVNICLVIICLGFMETKTTVGYNLYYLVVPILCAMLISYCYFRLYMVTKTQGIWHSRFSRARVTLCIHGILLLLYFAPGFVFSMAIILFHRKDINRDIQVWISTINMSVLMFVPRACAPYLYGLRYREINESLMQLFHLRRLNQITNL